MSAGSCILTRMNESAHAVSIPFIDLQAQRRRLESELAEATDRVLKHGRFILGPEVEQLEERLREFCGAGHAIGCANGTDALVLALRALDMQPGQAVVCPSFTFCATAEAVALLGGVPVFADVRRATFNLDPDSLERAIGLARDLGHDPVGVIAVDLFGLPADYEAIEATAEREGLWVVADAAQSFGGARDDRSVGGFGTITTTSFFPAKPLGCYGDGGALLTDDADRAELLRSLRVHGSGSHKYDNVHVGLNSRLDTLQAAILLVKLSVFADELEARQLVADRYERALEETVEVPRLPPGARSAWAQYTVLLPEGADRDGIQARLRERGIPTAVYYGGPLHRQTAYRDFPAVEVPSSELLAERVLSLPMHPYLDEETQERIVAGLKSSLG